MVSGSGSTTKTPQPRLDIEAVELQNHEKTGINRRGSSTSSNTLHNKDKHIAHNELQKRSTRQSSGAELLCNPLSGMTEEEVMCDVNTVVDSKGLHNHRDAFQKGAMLAGVQQREDGFEYLSSLTEEEKGVLRHEKLH